MNRRIISFSLICLIFSISFLSSENFVAISDVRPPFFLLDIPESSGRVTKGGIIYSKEGLEVGKFRILDISNNKALCECLDYSANLNIGCYINVGSDSGTIQNLIKLPITIEPAIKTSYPTGIIKVRGIKFTEQKKGIFITKNPIPLSMVPDISFNGIDDFMKKIENRYFKKCKVNYLETIEIKEHFVKKEEMIMLGVKSGIPVLVSISDSGFRENRVSEKILSKLKYEIYIPLKLKRL